MAEESQRQLKVGRLLQRDLSEMFQKELRPVIGSSFVTITKVKMSPDLGIAYIYLSFLQSKDIAKVLEALDENAKQVRLQLGNKIRHQMRIVPELRFFTDNSAEEGAKMEQLINSITIPKETKVNFDDYVSDELSAADEEEENTNSEEEEEDAPKRPSALRIFRRTQNEDRD